MQVTIFGASGRVGQLVVRQLLTDGHRVTAFVHKTNPFGEQDNLSVVKGDVTDAQAVNRALKGSEAVISALGSWGTQPKNILVSGMQTIVPAMEAQRITRIITVTGSAATWSGDKMQPLDRANHAFLKLLVPKILLDGEEHLRLLEQSSLNWTSIRSPIMTGKNSTAYVLNNHMGWPLAYVPRKAVVQALIDQLTDTNFLKQAPVIH